MRLAFLAVLAALTLIVSPGSVYSRGWKAGVSSMVITPKESMWLAGYANRDHPSEGVLGDLWAKALALQDEKGRMAVIVTADLVGIPREFSDSLRDQLQAKFHLTRAQILINTSHTHTGPVLKNALVDIYPLNEVQQQKIEAYTWQLKDQLIKLVGNAITTMQPVQLYVGNGVSRFQVNRRNNVEAALASQIQLQGPNDYAVPTIKVTNANGKIIAIAFGYACHNTVLNGYKFSGDYAGFAQSELEKLHPGATALFLQGCGANQNPLPRRTVALAQQYGEELASAVQRVLNEDMKELVPHLSTAYAEIDLPLNLPPTKEDLSKMMIDLPETYQKRWAARLLKDLQRGDTLMTKYSYPVQVWKLGDQPIISLGGEVVVEYAIELKRIFGQDIFVFGYSNDVMAYIPNLAILREGGYEGAASQMVYGLPNTWKPNVESLIIQKTLQLAQQLVVPMPGSKVN